MEQKFCSSCSRTKPACDFLHPIKGTPGKTCAACIQRKSRAASTSAGVDATATLQLHTTRLDDHEQRITDVESTLAGARADLAEWLALRDPAEVVEAGDVVECLGDKISRKVTGEGRLFIVSTEPLLTGNLPSEEVRGTGRVVTMIGQAPAKVAGVVSASQCLTPSGRNDGVLVATEQRTGFVAMEAAACQDGVLSRMVRVLVNCGDTAFEEFGNDALRDASDLAALASTHSCVRVLIEEKKQLSAALRGVRLLLRDPSARLLQRVGRGLIGRSRAKSRLAAVRKIQALVRRRAKCKFVAAATIQAACARGPPCVTLRRKSLRAFTKLQGRERVRMARKVCHHKRCIRSSIVIAAAWRRYHVLSTTLFGKLLSKTRCLAKKLAKANELLAANERELKNVVHATLCVSSTESVPPTDTVVAEGASPFIKVLWKIIPAIIELCYPEVSEVLAQSTLEDLKVEVHGKHIRWNDDAKKKGLPSQFHTGKLVKMDNESGLYEVELDSIFFNPGTPQQKKYRDSFSAQNFRIL